MIRVPLSALLLAAAPAWAQTPPPAPPEAPAAQAVPATPQSPALAPAAPAPPVRQYRTQRVALATAAGMITIALEVERAPVTAANFLRYVDQKRLDGTTFYRAMKFATVDAGLIQGGPRGDAKRLLPAIAHEPTTRTGLSHTDGAVSMGRLAPGTAQGDFFIVVGDLRGLDANPKAPGDNAGFAVFGQVVDGMDAVRAIQNGKVDPNAGAGAMKGQILAAPVRIVNARRVK